MSHKYSVAEQDDRELALESAARLIARGDHDHQKALLVSVNPVTLLDMAAAQAFVDRVAESPDTERVRGAILRLGTKGWF